MQRIVTLLITMSVLVLPCPREARAGAAVDAGGGFLVPFDGDHREIYGAAGLASLGVSASVGDGHTWLFAQGGFAKSSGDEFPADPTFEIGKAEYRLYPIEIGVRTDVLRGPPDRRVGFFLGAAWQTIFTTWEDVNGESFDSPTLGLALQIRPSYRLGERTSVWVSQRLSMIGSTDYNRRVNQLNYSGSILEFGVSLLVN